jgi:leader peptidase (prepilin peptidase)/N-methyltransferase
LRYPVVEITTAVTLLLLVTQTGLRLITIIYAILCCGMIVATFVDLKHSIIPDEISYGGIALGIILSIIYPKLHNTDNRLQALFFSIAGILVGGALIYSISAAGSLIFRKKLKQIGEESAMGGGDIKYLAMIGAFLGYKYVLFVFFLAPLFGSIVGIIMKLRYKAEIIPYGPYLSLATLVVILWGERIWRILYPYL